MSKGAKPLLTLIHVAPSSMCPIPRALRDVARVSGHERAVFADEVSDFARALLAARCRSQASLRNAQRSNKIA